MQRAYSIIIVLYDTDNGKAPYPFSDSSNPRIYRITWDIIK